VSHQGILPARQRALGLKFALRYEPIDLSVHDALFKVLDGALLEAWLRQDPQAPMFAEPGFYMRR
jgi:hypothetical protein